MYLINYIFSPQFAVGIEPVIPVKTKVNVVTGGQLKTQSQVCYMCSLNEVPLTANQQSPLPSLPAPLACQLMVGIC